MISELESLGIQLRLFEIVFGREVAMCYLIILGNKSKRSASRIDLETSILFLTYLNGLPDGQQGFVAIFAGAICI